MHRYGTTYALSEIREGWNVSEPAQTRRTVRRTLLIVGASLVVFFALVVLILSMDPTSREGTGSVLTPEPASAVESPTP